MTKVTYNFSAVPKKHSDILYATVTAENAVGLQISAFSSPISVDDTAPEKGVIVELPSIARIDPTNETRTVEMTRTACSSEKGIETIVLTENLFTLQC